MHQRASQFFFFWLRLTQRIEENKDKHVSVTSSLCLIFSGEGEIRCVQLDMVTKWIDDFQEAKRQADEDVVFDVLCGDFNFDNCSPGACVDNFLLFF